MHLIPKGQKAFKVGTKENKLHLMLHKTSSISYQSLFHAFSSGILKISSPVHNQTVLSLPKARVYLLQMVGAISGLEKQALQYSFELDRVAPLVASLMQLDH